MIHVRDVKVNKNYVNTFSRLVSRFKSISEAVDEGGASRYAGGRR